MVKLAISPGCWTHSVAQTRGALHKTIQALKRIKQDENALDANDLNLLQTLPMLTSLTSLVLHYVGIVDIPNWSF